MNEKNKNLLVRIASSVTLLPIVLYLFYRGGLYSGLLLGVASAGCMYEYCAIVRKQPGPMSWMGMAFAFAMPLIGSLYPARAAEFGFWLVSAYFLVVWSWFLMKGPLEEAPALVSQMLTGLLYAAIGMTALSALRNAENGFAWVFCALAITWLNDTSAYFSGRLFGKHKLYPEVSPNKTWEGFAGGMAGSLAAMFLARAFLLPALSTQDCLIVGLAGGVLGPVGDLCESLLKRAYQVKDSGMLVPGHGGLLDRVDALLFNAPMVFLYATQVFQAS